MLRSGSCKGVGVGECLNPWPARVGTNLPLAQVEYGQSSGTSDIDLLGGVESPPVIRWLGVRIISDGSGHREHQPEDRLYLKVSTESQLLQESSMVPNTLSRVEGLFALALGVRMCIGCKRLARPRATAERHRQRFPLEVLLLLDQRFIQLDGETVARKELACLLMNLFDFLEEFVCVFLGDTLHKEA